MKVYARQIIATAILMLAAFPAMRSAGAQEDIDLAPGWDFEVFAAGLVRADNVVVTATGDLYISLEIDDGDGRVVRIRDGQFKTVARGLNRPDGLALDPPFLFITEEVKNGRVIRLDLSDLTVTTLQRLYKPEGIVVLADGSVLVAEDRREGRLVRIDANGQIEVLLDALARPEGIAMAPDGAIFIAETGTGRIVRWTESTVEVAIEGLDEPDQVEFATDGSLWISEDRSPGRLLRFHDGQLEVIADGLADPQGIAFGPNGLVYLVEQGHDRVLVLNRTPAGN